MDVLTPAQRSKNMRAIRSKNTKMEIVLAKALWANGVRYRKHDCSVYGRPDLTIKRHKIAIFVDSEYFHGKDWETEKYRIKSKQLKLNRVPKFYYFIYYWNFQENPWQQSTQIK